MIIVSDFIALMELERLRSSIQCVESTTLEFNKLFQNESESDMIKDTKKCFELFLDLAAYLNQKMHNEIKEEKARQLHLQEKQNEKFIKEEMTANNEDSKINAVKCNFCDFETINSHEIELHKNERHLEIKLKCEECPFTALQKSNISLHNQKAHQGIVFPCPSCKFIAPNFVILKGHIKLEHDKVEKKICLKCGFETSDLKEFKKHQKIVHSKGTKITQYRNS